VVTEQSSCRLALVGSSIESLPDGFDDATPATARIGYAIARSGRFQEVDIFLDPSDPVTTLRTARALCPPHGHVRVRPRSDLPFEEEPYHVALVSGLRSGTDVAAAARPSSATPIVYDIGAVHSPRHLQALQAAASSRALGAGDGIVLPSAAQREFLEHEWETWRDQGLASDPPSFCVLPSAVTLDAQPRSRERRAAVRRKLRLRDHEVAFLVFAPLTASVVAEATALTVLWREVAVRAPGAVLLIAGPCSDRGLEACLANAVRSLGDNKVLLLANPHETWPDARGALLAAGDVLLHVLASADEGVPAVVLEAMAAEMPVLAIDWGGVRDVVRHGEDGWLVESFWVPPVAETRRSLAALEPRGYSAALLRYVAWEGRALLERAAWMGADVERVREMGARARSRVLARFTLEHAVADRLAFFDDLAVRAAQLPHREIQPTVEPESILACQAGRALEPGDVVALSTPSPRRPLAAPLAPAVVAALADGPKPCSDVCLQLLASVGDAPLDGTTDPESWSVSAHALRDLLVSGLIEVVRPAASTPEAEP
jgi:glycosyltransferase involved in cell wall biosynthesis